MNKIRHTTCKESTAILTIASPGPLRFNHLTPAQSFPAAGRRATPQCDMKYYLCVPFMLNDKLTLSDWGKWARGKTEMQKQSSHLPASVWKRFLSYLSWGIVPQLQMYSFLESCVELQAQNNSKRPYESEPNTKNNTIYFQCDLQHSQSQSTIRCEPSQTFDKLCNQTLIWLSCQLRK